MANYSQWIDYFRQLAIENNLIKHDPVEANEHKKFFRMNIDELYVLP